MDVVPKEDREIQVKNPLLWEDVLDKVFPYLGNDVQSLCSSRLVCKTWNKAANRVFKFSVRWKITTEVHKILEFTDLMIHSTKKIKIDLLRNFHIYQPIPDITNRKRTVLGIMTDRTELQQFMRLFGSFILDLKFSSHELYNLVECSKSLPNLEHLQVYGVSPIGVMGKDLIIYDFPTLKSFSVKPANVNVTVFQPSTVLVEATLVANVTACSKVLVTTPQLTHLQLCGYACLKGALLKAEGYNLKFLTSLRTSVRFELGELQQQPSVARTLFALRETDLIFIAENCVNLKQFSAIFADNVREDFVYSHISAISRTIEELDLELCARPNQERNNKETFPSCPALKKITLRNWQLGNNFNWNLPSLTSLDLLNSIFSLPIIGPTNGHPSVSKLRLGGPANNEDALDVVTVTALAAVFPRLEELEIGLQDDKALRAIYTRMPQLKRLHLGYSKITDAGITGIPLANLRLQFRHSSVQNYGDVNLDHLRQFPFIGDLKYLQHFTIRGSSLSKYSVHYGLTSLKELTYLKVPPYLSVQNTIFFIEKVPARALADNCPALVKLDVTGLTPPAPTNDNATALPGCGLPGADIEYLKASLPHLHLVYGDSKSLSQLVQEEDDNDTLIYLI